MADFHVVDIAFDSKVENAHKLFYKKHVGKDADKNTIFLMNIPPYCNEEGLKTIFSDCGAIKEVVITENPSSSLQPTELELTKIIKAKNYKFKYGYITFVEKSSLDVAVQISFSKVKRLITSEESSIETGLNKWINTYVSAYPKESTLQNIVNDYMVEYDLEEAKKAESQQNEGEPDDEGWITIPVKKKKSNQDETSKINKKLNKKLEKKKRTEKELMSFYLFQQRDEKREKIATLRHKFEEDKKRIAQMRQQRKFKPF